ncbi:hypothetical protein FNF31_00890 [Cafeteria roenbergensis]|uniref:Uncharacterized protein n=1 Tax=Cafeteria roenbergensis TaxID=33653 RepID=A0A5A8DUI0_CAFRO|nr:hypothetical protein FNF31_00890 [Cafeteria roenbergensis]
MSNARSAAVAAFADSGARAAAASADSSAEGKSDDEAGDAGAVSSDEDIDALSVCAAAPTARSEGPSGRGRDEPVADDPDPAAAMDAEHAARLTGAASLLRPAGPEQLLWAADGFVMGADGGSTEVELRQKERRRVAVQSAARPQPRWQAATLQDDLQSLGARPDPSWTGRRGRRVHQLGLASAYECYRYLLPEEDPDALPEPRGGGDGRAPGADDAALPGATQRHHRGESGGRLLEAAGGDRDGDAASAADSFEYHPPSTHRAVVADSDSDGADFGSDVGEDFGSDVGEDVGEDVGSTGRRRARSSAQPGIGRSASSGTCASSGALSDAWDGDASSTGSPRPEEEECDGMPPARGRRRSRSRHQPCQIPTRAAGLGPGIKQAPRLGPAELQGLAPAEARLSALLHRSSRWEPPLGRAEPGMTVLSPVGTPGGDGLDDTPCHPGERFRRTRAARQCLEGADSPTAPPAPDADARSDVSADSAGAWSSGDGPVTVACVDYIFYTAQLLELAAVGRIPTALLPDEVPDATNTLEAADDEILPNSARASNHLGLLARFRIKTGSLPAAAQAGYQH